MPPCELSQRGTAVVLLFFGKAFGIRIHGFAQSLQTLADRSFGVFSGRVHPKHPEPSHAADRVGRLSRKAAIFCLALALKPLVKAFSGLKCIAVVAPRI